MGLFYLTETMEDLKITHSLPKSSRPIDWYTGKQTKVAFTLNGIHDIEITLKHGWRQEDFIEAIMGAFSTVFLEYGETPEAVHITKLEEDISVLN